MVWIHSRLIVFVVDRTVLKLLALPEITFKNLRCVMKVAEFGSVARAAEEVARSQTAVTKAVHKVEQSIGVSLFDRSSTGMWPTAEGQLLASRIVNAHDELRRAGRAYRKIVNSKSDIDALPIFNMGVRKQSLASLILVLTNRDTHKTAELLGVNLVTVQRAIRGIESQLQTPLFERSATGQFMPTLVAQEVGRAVKIAFAEVASGIDEIASMGEHVSGHLRIGSLPFVRKTIVPDAIVKLVTNHPGISVTTNEADFEAQEAALRSGELDLIVGPTSVTANDVDLIAEPFVDMSLRFVVRERHPLVKKGSMSKSDMASLGWVLPPKPTGHRVAFDKFLDKYLIRIDGQVVETSLYNAARNIVQNSDLALISRQSDAELEPLVALTPDFISKEDAAQLTIVSHIVTRRRTTMSPAARLYISLLRETAGEVASDLE